MNVQWQVTDALRNPQSAKEAWRAWSDFLMAANSIYSKLEQGAKSNGKSSAWFGRIKRIRKNDELLCYLHHARNTDEHGLEDSLKLKAPKLETVSMETKADPSKHGKELIIRDATNRIAFRVTINNGLHLVPVSDDRYGDTFPVPSYHLGKRLESGPVVGIADLALTYLEGLIAEADALTK